MQTASSASIFQDFGIIQQATDYDNGTTQTRIEIWFYVVAFRRIRKIGIFVWSLGNVNKHIHSPCLNWGNTRKKNIFIQRDNSFGPEF